MSSFGNSYGINLPAIYGAAMQARQFQDEQAGQSALAKYAPDVMDPNKRAAAVTGAMQANPKAGFALAQWASKLSDQEKADFAQKAQIGGQLAGAVLNENVPDAQLPDAVLTQIIPQAKQAGLVTDDVEQAALQAKQTGNVVRLRQLLQNKRDSSMTIAQQLSQSNADRTFAAGRSDHADTVNYQNRSLAIQQEKAAQGDASSLTPEAADMLGSIALTNGGTVPSFGMGGGKQKAAIFNNMAGKAKAQGITGEDIATGAASFKANSQALAQITKAQTAIGSYEQTASQNADIALGLMQKGAGPTGSPVVDRWIRAGGKSIAGDADVSKFDTALNTFKNEYAKVMSGGYGAAGTSDSMRHEADTLISPNMSREQILGNIQVMKQDMANRTKALNDYRSNLVQHIHSGASSIYQPVTGASAAQPVTQTPAAPAGWSIQKIGP